MPTLSKEDSQLINDARRLSNDKIDIYLDDHELIRLCSVVASDLGQINLLPTGINSIELSTGYYSINLDWFKQPLPGVDFKDYFIELTSKIEDFQTYFKLLCSLHKRRRKYQLILECQPLPKMEQIVPRCLLEFGLRPSETLASWLVWRKWLYDIDNRSAQETGYLFEPILAAAIGGVSYGHSKSPIKRTKDSGKGRQVDCIIDKLAYEFKMRVTIAASGQGRFSEELDFAEDCSKSGYTPILLVLDPTPSTRLAELARTFSEFGGKAYIGEDAWDHIVDQAGSVMGTFVEKYVKAPLLEVETANGVLKPLQLTFVGNAINVGVGDHSFTIDRAGTCAELVDDNVESPEE